MSFNKCFGITHTKDMDWFDPLLDQDTPLFIDPFLVFEDENPLWAGAREEIIDFFDTAARLLERSGGNTKSAAYAKVIRLLHFPEPNEFALGLTMGKPQGSGTGKDFAESMAKVLNLAHAHGHVADLASIQGFRLFADGVGRDRVSDILCNILKNRFIKYTQIVADEHDIKTELVQVKCAAWDKGGARWVNKKVALPKSPDSTGGVILTPERFLKEIPTITSEGFWRWAEVAEGHALREDFGFEITEGLNQAERRLKAREFARKHPDKAWTYIKIIDGKPHHPYDVENDPKGLVYWREIGEEQGLKIALDQTDLPATQSGFNNFVDLLASKFKHQIEHTDLWKALWSVDGPQKEEVVQAIAGAMWTVACENADVDLSQEVNRGRGPVDFKFSRGWQKRALIEIKLIHNSRFFKGAEKQLPQYLDTEQIDYGVYLCVGHFDKDFAPERIKRVNETAKAIADLKGITIKVVVVDARRTNKTSASKIK
jgi:hypothetical protein